MRGIPFISTIIALVLVAGAFLYVSGRIDHSRHRLLLIPPEVISTIPQAGSDSCPQTGKDCRGYILALVNAARATKGEVPLVLDKPLSKGIGCVGALGHSRAMADTGTIWHIAPDEQHAGASFDRDMQGCIGNATIEGQNVGAAFYGTRAQAVTAVFNEMMAEPHDTASCDTLYAEHSTNHACTILDKRYTRIGIGIARNEGNTFITMDFLGSTLALHPKR